MAIVHQDPVESHEVAQCSYEAGVTTIAGGNMLTMHAACCLYNTQDKLASTARYIDDAMITVSSGPLPKQQLTQEFACVGCR